MRRALLAMAVALVAGIVLPSPGVAGPDVKRSGQSVAEFVTMAANAGDAATPVTTDAALRALERLGVYVDDPDAELTQGMLARIMGGLGHPASTREPAATAGTAMIGTALRLIGSSPLNPLQSISTDFFPPPQAPGGCLFSGVDCMQCCLRFRIPFDGCARFCQAAVPSPSSPI